MEKVVVYVKVDDVDGSCYWERKEVLEKFVERYELKLKNGKGNCKGLEDIYNLYKYCLNRNVCCVF